MAEKRRTVVVSTNNNPDYYFYTPYIERAWNILGWDLAILITQDVDTKELLINNPDTMLMRIPEIKGLRSETLAQGGRLYAANYMSKDTFIMTSDMDMLPLSDYCKPKYEDITIHGHDLTDYTYYPMGYAAMNGHKWKEVMNLTGLTENDFERDAKAQPICYAPDWETWWNWDWRVLTDKLAPYKKQIKFVPRGRREGEPFAFGRIDRGDSMKIIPGPWIDAHCENNNVRHESKLLRFLEIFEATYGKL